MPVTHALVTLTQLAEDTLLAANGARIGFEIYNEGPGSMRLGLDGTATATVGIPIPEGGHYRVNGTEGVDNTTGEWPNQGELVGFPLQDHSGAGGQDASADLVVNVVEWETPP